MMAESDLLWLCIIGLYHTYRAVLPGAALLKLIKYLFIYLSDK